MGVPHPLLLSPPRCTGIAGTPVTTTLVDPAAAAFKFPKRKRAMIASRAMSACWFTILRLRTVTTAERAHRGGGCYVLGAGATMAVSMAKHQQQQQQHRRSSSGGGNNSGGGGGNNNGGGGGDNNNNGGGGGGGGGGDGGVVGGFARMAGGNPDAPPCADFANGRCTRRLCAFSHE